MQSKQIMFVSLAVALLGLPGRASAQDIKFTDYKIGYSFKTIRVSDIKQHHFVFLDFKDFATQFDAKQSRFYTGPRIDEDLFKDHIVLGVLKVGKAQYEFKPGRVTRKDDVLQVRYEVKVVREEKSLIRSKRMLLSIPKQDVKSVQFIEGDKVVKTLDVP